MPWYSLRSEKEHATEVEQPWTNVWEFFRNISLTDEPAQNIMSAVREFERKLTFSHIRFSDATVSSWTTEDESENTNDELFQFTGASAFGLRPSDGVALPLEHTLAITKQPFVGQKGKLSLRGCLNTGDVLLTPRGYVMVPAARTFFDNILVSAWEELTGVMENEGAYVGMVSYPIVGWAEKPTAPGSKPKFKPVYGVDLYERQVKNMKVKGAGKIQLRQH